MNGTRRKLLAVSTTPWERHHHLRPNLNPRARAFPISRARGSSARCGVAEIVNAAEARDAADGRMNIVLSSIPIKVNGTNSTGVRC